MRSDYWQMEQDLTAERRPWAISESLSHGLLSRFAFCAWAACVGVSVTLQLLNSVTLNRYSADPTYHSVYISQITVLLGGLVAAPSATLEPKPWSLPRQWWTLLGGLCTVPQFALIAAGPYFGTEITLLGLLLGQLGTAFLVDVFNGKLALENWPRLLGFAIVLGGIVANSLSLGGGPRQPLQGQLGLQPALMLLGCVATGSGYALQAMCNGGLAEDLGHPARATVVCTVTNVLSNLPLLAAVYWGLHVMPVVSLSDWPRFLFAGVQNAFFIGSLSVLPRHLGYTLTYMCIQTSNLAASAVSDAYGLSGHLVPASFQRLASIACVVLGAGLFSAYESPSSRAGQKEITEEEMGTTELTFTFKK